MEYRDPVDLMDLPSNMKIGLCWYRKGIDNKWTYNLPVHLMAYLETIIAIASMTCIIELHAYELHLGDEKLLNEVINEC